MQKSTMALGIRSANPLDGGYIRDVLLQSAAQTGLRPEQVGLEMVLQHLEIALEQGIALVAVDGINQGQVVGYAHWLPAGHFWEKAGWPLRLVASASIPPEQVTVALEKALQERGQRWGW